MIDVYLLLRILATNKKLCQGVGYKSAVRGLNSNSLFLSNQNIQFNWLDR